MSERLITVSMEFHSMQELQDFTAQFTGGAAVGAVDGARITISPEIKMPAGTFQDEQGAIHVPATAPQPEKKKPGRPPKAAAEPDPLMPAAATPAAEVKPVTIDDVRAVLMSYNSKFGLPALGKKLEEVAGVKSMKGLKTSQYAEVHKAFTDALAG